MSRAFALACALAATASLAGAARAAEPTPAAPAPAPAASAAAPLEADARSAREAGEPAVRRTVIQDDSARIDELRVRGQLTRVTVDPKGRLPAYEILTPGGARDLSDGPSPSRGAAGKRVWSVLRF